MTDQEMFNIINELYIIKNYPIRKVIEQSKLTGKQINRILKKFNIKKSIEAEKKCKYIDYFEKNNIKENDINDIIKSVYDLYINQNLSKENISQILDISFHVINHIITTNKFNKTKSDRAKSANEKRKQTCLDKYGYECVFQSDEVKNKFKQNSLKKYGVDHPNKANINKTKIKNSWALKSNEEKQAFKEKISKTKLNKSQDEKNKIIQKVKQIKKEKYGDENYRNDKKIKQTCLDKYGYDNPMKVDYIKDKVKQTCKIKYGVDHESQRHLSSKTLSIISSKDNLKSYILDNNIKYYYELVDLLKMSPSHLGKIIRNFDLEYLITKLSNRSQFEIDLEKLLNSWNIKNNVSDRNTIYPQEIDLFIPEFNFGIEFNGNYWHFYNEKDIKRKVNNLYHQNKSLKAKEKGIFIYHIFEYEWNNERKREIIKSQLRNLCHRNENKVYARNCEIKEIKDNNLIKEFLDKNHLQGYRSSKIKLGLFYNDELVSVMTFGKPYLSKSNKYEWELYRFCNKLNTSVIGGFNKLFKYFIRTYNPKNILTYSDFAKGDGHTYEKMGFKKLELTKPNYIWWKETNLGDEIKTRYQTQMKNETKIMEENNYLRIYDCGNFKWEWNNKD